MTDQQPRHNLTTIRQDLPRIDAEPRAEGPWSKELVKAIAMDIGKEIAAYIEVMYPKAVEATSSTFLLSVRNSIYNEIMAAIEVNDAGQITARIKDRKDFRRKWESGVQEDSRQERGTEMTEQHHPDYHKGFYDAQDGAPVYIEQCTSEYVAGWYAYWNVRAALGDDDDQQGDHE